MENEFGFPRKMAQTYKEVAARLAKVQEQIKHVVEAHAELEKAIEILDEAALDEMRSRRVKDYLKKEVK